MAIFLWDPTVTSWDTDNAPLAAKALHPAAPRSSAPLSTTQLASELDASRVRAFLAHPWIPHLALTKVRPPRGWPRRLPPSSRSHTPPHCGGRQTCREWQPRSPLCPPRPSPGRPKR